MKLNIVIFILGILVLFVCGQEGPTDSSPSTSTTIVTNTTLAKNSNNFFYSIAQDYIKCKPTHPICGGYSMKKVNLFEDEVYVYDIRTNIHLEMDNINEYILEGYVTQGGDGKNIFVAEGAHRILPIAIESSARIDFIYYGFVQDEKAILKLNTGNITLIKSYSDPYTTGPFNLQSDWLVNRIKHRSLFTGYFDFYDDSVFKMQQVYIEMPDAGPCPPQPLFKCQADYRVSYTRNIDRCLIAQGCMKNGPCGLWVPNCQPGYTLSIYISGPNACPHYYCDPAFLTRSSGVKLPH
ncbi:hypothetical protein CYY_004168 [Polysphondylium violaceum]|uniref:Carbohydrate binding domain-containing protein n=1 Tax=Polysphondylium violaceum TaxID=133409 RepID=A0A8J4PVV9_9MYCE|nr:hypothetical protein CYY_004168 [Polysphondylium violaceum]